MNELKITPPEGYEVDKKHSTFDCIKFKKIESKGWETFCKNYPNIDGEYFIDVFVILLKFIILMAKAQNEK